MSQQNYPGPGGPNAAFSNPAKPGLLVLAALQTLMLAALYTRTPPHPPMETPLFALGPFISASIALALAALAMERTRAGLIVSLMACLTALVSYGPQKWFDAAFGSIWPAVILAQIAIVTVLVQSFREFKAGQGET